MFTQNSAEAFALDALLWLAGNDDLMPVFLNASGASVDDIKTRAGDADFLGSVLDFLLMDDAWVIAFCDEKGCKYEDPMMARQSLPGGGNVHWT